MTRLSDEICFVLFLRLYFCPSGAIDRGGDGPKQGQGAFLSGAKFCTTTEAYDLACTDRVRMIDDSSMAKVRKDRAMKGLLHTTPC